MPIIIWSIKWGTVRISTTECKKPIFELGFYQKKYGYLLNHSNFTFEAVIVAIADEIAQRHHDVEDGLRFKILKKEEILSIFEFALDPKTKNKLKTDDIETFISIVSSSIVSTYVKKTIIKFQDKFSSIGRIKLPEFIESNDSLSITKLWKEFDLRTFIENDDAVRDLLKNRMLNSYETQIMDGRAYYIISHLFKAYISNPQQLPDSTIRVFFEEYNKYYQDNSDRFGLPNALKDFNKNNEDYRGCLNKAHKNGSFVYKGILLRTMCDFISGMTDRKAISEYQRLYGIEKDIVIK